MSKVPILMPQLGESIAEATVVKLGIAVGDAVQADQEVIEVETNKATMGVTTLCAGRVVELRAQEGVSYPVGTILGIMEVTEEEVVRTGVRTLDPRPAPPAAPAAAEGAAPAAAPATNVHFAGADDGGGYSEPPRDVIPSVRGLPVTGEPSAELLQQLRRG